MEFLLELGIDKITIKELNKKYEESIINNIILNSSNVMDVINYFLDLGIADIDSLLIYDISLFTKDIEIIKEHFKENKEEKIRLINEDIININNI